MSTNRVNVHMTAHRSPPCAPRVPPCTCQVRRRRHRSSAFVEQDRTDSETRAAVAGTAAACPSSLPEWPSGSPCASSAASMTASMRCCSTDDGVSRVGSIEARDVWCVQCMPCASPRQRATVSRAKQTRVSACNAPPSRSTPSQPCSPCGRPAPRRRRQHRRPPLHGRALLLILLAALLQRRC